MLTTPPTDADLAHLAHLRPVVRDLAVAMELWDGRSRFDWCDLAKAQAACVDLADAPMSWEALRFPGPETARACMNMADGYVVMIEEKWLRTYPERRRELGDALCEARERYWAWYAALQVAECWNVAQKREKLRDLRRLLGERDYYLGVMPEPIPYHRCVRMD